MMNQNQNILVLRYLQLLKQVRPTLVAKKNPEGSLELSHILWMLEKMNSPSYEPLTTHSAWISWVQASLFIPISSLTSNMNVILLVKSWLVNHINIRIT